MKKAKVKFIKDTAGKFRFSVVAANGEIVCQSEGYETKANANRGFGDLAQAVLDILAYRK